MYPLKSKEKKSRVTMKDVAKKAGVSASTVCRALNANPQIPEGTRRHIQKVAEKIGYRPDPLLSAFASRRRGKVSGTEVTTIAYITNFPESRSWQDNPYYLRAFDGATRRADEFGYKLEHFWLNEPEMSGSRLSKILYSRGIQAICVAPTSRPEEELALDWDRFSAVTMGYSVAKPNLHRSTPHHFHAIGETLRQLRSRGYQRVGLSIFAETNVRADELWLAGALLHNHQAPGITHRPRLHVDSFLFTDKTLKDVPAWCRREGLEVVVSDNQVVMHELQKAGIRVPGDVDFATVNHERHHPEISGIDQRPELIGAAAMDIVISMVQRSERGLPEVPHTTLIEGIWAEGSSLSRAPQSP